MMLMASKKSDVWRCCAAGEQQVAMLLLPPFCCAIDALPSSLLVEDLERNEGSPSRPYFVTPSLMKLLMEHKTAKKQ